MKPFIFLFFILISVPLMADPIEHMTKSQATELAQKIQNDQFFLDYCDCCDSAEARFVQVASAEVIPCSYYENMYSVEVRGTSIVTFSTGAGVLMLPSEVFQDPFKEVISLNYSWGLSDEQGKMMPLGFLTNYWTEHTCIPFKVLPDPQKYEDHDFPKLYQNWFEEEVSNPFHSKYPRESAVVEFKGTINKKYPISMKVNVADYGDIYGSYQYDKVGKDIEISGSFNSYGGFEIAERVEGKVTGTFRGYSFDPKGIEGIWESNDGKKYFSFELKGVEASGAKWTGTYYREGDFFDGGNLVIGRETETSFDFMLDVWNSCHMGYAEGTAQIDEETATYEAVLYDDAAACIIKFEKTEFGLQLEGGTSMDCEFGMRAYAGGSYLPGREPEKYYDFLDYLSSLDLKVSPESINDTIQMLVDEESQFQHFAYLTRLDYGEGQCENLDDFEASVYCIFVPGCAEEQVFMVQPNGMFYLWNRYGGYFTNDPKYQSDFSDDLDEKQYDIELEKLPKTIQSFVRYD